MSDQADTRRGFMRFGVLGAALVGLGGHVVAWARSLVPNVLYEPPMKRRLGPPAQFPQGRTFLAEHKLFLLRDKDALRALSAVCSHLGCTVGTKQAGFHCPCHGSVFDEEGVNTSGPAPSPLAWHPLSLRGGSVIVDLGSEVGAADVLSLAKGEGQG